MKKQIPEWKKLISTVNEGANVTMRQPLVEILGDKRVLIEQHQGVISYGHHEIGVRVNMGILLITGKSLRLSRMAKDQLVVCGCVECIRFLKTREGNCHD